MAPDDDGRIPQIRYEEDDEEANKATVVGAVSGRPRERAYLMVVGGDESVGRCFPVVDGMILGRGAAADVSLSEDGVSRRHARVSRVGDDALYFEDCGSSNGMLYRHARVSSQTVREGDRIQIGGAVLLPFFVDASGYAFEKNLYLSATEDASTHLTHRAHFMAAAARECDLAARYRVPVSFVVFAIDQHHAVLQTHGAALATHLFKAVAHVARAHDAPRLLLARRDVDTLSAMLPDATLDRALAWAESVRLGVRAIGVDLGDRSLPVKASAGVASAPAADPPSDAQELLVRAEARLASAKLAGGDRVVGPT